MEETRFGLSICYDVRFPELYRGLMAAGAEVLCVPSQFQFTTGKDHWHTLLRARAIENQCFVVAPGQWGPFGDPAEGTTFLRPLPRRRPVGPDRWSRRPRRATGVWVADLDLAALRSLRHRFPALQHRRLGASC